MCTSVMTPSQARTYNAVHLSNDDAQLPTMPCGCIVHPVFRRPTTQSWFTYDRALSMTRVLYYCRGIRFFLTKIWI